MAANRNLIFAGVAGGGAAGTQLASFAPLGSTMPTTASGVLDPAFKDTGWITEDGLKEAVAEQTTDIKAFGTQVPVRTLISESKVTFDIGFLETNPVTQAIYGRKALDAIVVSTVDGSFDFTEGAASIIQYAAVFDIVDGSNRLRAVCPQVQVTGRSDKVFKMNDAVKYGVTFTAYPGSDGVAVHWFVIASALKV